MNTSIEIRHYRDEDFDQIFDLNEAVLQAIDPSLHWFLGWDDDLQYIVADCLQRQVVCLVGEVQDTTQTQIIAMGILRPIDDLRGEIRGMRVHPTHQNLGLGKLMLSRLENAARELDYRVLQLDTTVLQHAAIRLYSKAGYLEVHRDAANGIEEIYFEKKMSD
ncbi:MAG: GNAT family N-acetyltransferase [Pirellulales bacterium]